MKEINWNNIEDTFPGASAEWDVQGGPAWQGDREGPRLFWNDPSKLYVYVGRAVDKTYMPIDWAMAIYYADRKKWAFGKSSLDVDPVI